VVRGGDEVPVFSAFWDVAGAGTEAVDVAVFSSVPDAPLVAVEGGIGDAELGGAAPGGGGRN
jgi:hypothetical protein